MEPLCHLLGLGGQVMLVPMRQDAPDKFVSAHFTPRAMPHPSSSNFTLKVCGKEPSASFPKP